jgi:hypothetical protein
MLSALIGVGAGGLGIAIGALVGFVRGGSWDSSADGAELGTVCGVVICCYIAVLRTRAGMLGAPSRIPRIGDFVDGWRVLRVSVRGGYRFEVCDGRRRHGTLRLVDLRAGREAGVAARRLEHEARVLGSADSPYLARMLGRGVVGDLCYLVTEYFPSPTVEESVRPLRGGPAYGGAAHPLTGESLFQAARGSLEAIVVLHDLGAVHGAMAPAAVILREDVGVLAGLGGRTAFEARLDPGPETHGYLPPEGPGGPAADVYSWAASMFFAATGLEPAHAASRATGVPDWLSPVLDAALLHDPSRRPSALELASALDRQAERYGWQLRVPAPPRAAPRTRPRPRWLTGAVLLGIVSVLIMFVTLPTAAGSSRPGSEGEGQQVATPSHSPSPSLSPTPASSSPSPTSAASTPAASSPEPETTQPSASPSATASSPSASPSPSAADAWPTTADDGSTALYAYFGSEIYFPDWTSCDATYCITSDDNGVVYAYTEHPIARIKQFSANVTSPYQQLVDNGFSAATARDLLKMD